MTVRSIFLTILLGDFLLRAASAPAATLTVQGTSLNSGQNELILVRGSVNNESTFGVNILVELVPRAGATGTLSFTPAPPTDIALAGNPWLGPGTYSPFDTDLTDSAALNGAVLDNGTFEPGPVTYDGLLVGLPIRASVHASGIWDAVLTTSSGDSSWEGLPTTLEPATITVFFTGTPATSTWGLAILTLLVASAGTVTLMRKPRAAQLS